MWRIEEIIRWIRDKKRQIRNSKILRQGIDTEVSGGRKKWIGLWDILDGKLTGLGNIIDWGWEWEP